MAEINQRISEIRSYFCGNNNLLFAEKLGKSHTYTSGLCGNEKVGKAALENILSAFPGVNRVWLITGEGTMLTTDADNEVEALKARISELEKENKQKDSTIASLVRILDNKQQPQIAADKKDVG